MQIIDTHNLLTKSQKNKIRENLKIWKLHKY